MQIKKLAFSLLTFCFITSFQSIETDYVKILHRTVRKPIAKILKENDLSPFGSGGAMMEDVEKMSYSFISKRQMSIEEARDLYVKIIHELLTQINASKELRPYLRHFPATIDDLDIAISFFDSRNTYCENGGLALVNYYCRDKTLRFHESINAYQFAELHKESFEVAEAIVAKTKSSAHMVYGC